jgi:hypothetical protein
VDRHQAATNLQRVAQLLQRGVGSLLNQLIEPLELRTLQRGAPMAAWERSRLARFALTAQPALKGGDIDAIAARHLRLSLPGRMGGQGAFANLL